MFSWLKKKKEEPAFLTATLEALDFFNHLDAPVKVLVNQDGQAFDQHVHVCLTQESFEEMSKVYGAQGQDYVLGIAADYALQRTETQSLVLHGFPAGSFELSREELETLRDVIDSFCILYAQARNRISPEQAYDLLKDKTFFYIGEPLTGVAGSRFGFETIELEGGKTAVKLFLTPASANQFNAAKRPVTPVNLADFHRFLVPRFQIIIEPHRNYWLAKSE